MAVPFELFILGGAWLLLILSLIFTELRIFKSLGSIMLLVMGVYTIYPGYGGISHEHLLGMALGTICIGVGAFYLIQPNVSFDRQVSHYDQYDDGRYHAND